MFIVKIIIGIMRLINALFKPCKIKNRVTFISRESNVPSQDILDISNEIKNRNKDIEIVCLCKKLEKGLGSKISYIFEILKHIYYINTSKIIILDTYCIAASVLSHKKEVKIVQIWHSIVAIKKFGYQTVGKKSGSSKEIADIMCMHKNYDYVIAPSIVTAKHFAEGFNTSLEKFKILGLPRMESIAKGGEVPKEELLNFYPGMREKKNILYAPTFRKNETVQLKEVVNAIDLSKYNLIVKLHPLDDLQKYNYVLGDVILDKNYETFEWIKVCDKIITDYSSIALESMIQDKEVYFYVYDLEKYNRDTGINIDFEKEAIKKCVAKNTRELKKVLEKPYDFEKTNQFKNKYIEVSCDGCTSKFVDFIFEIIDS